MPKIIKHSKYGYRITIPKEIMRGKKWKKGQMLYFALNHKTMEVSLIDMDERLRAERRHKNANQE